MNSQDMIAEFLKNKEVTACPDEDRETIDNGELRYGRGKTKSNLKGIHARSVKKMICELCLKEDSVTKQGTGNYSLRGMVNGEYKGDVWCTSCRYKKINEAREKHNQLVAEEKAVIEFGSIENAKRFKEATKILTKDIIKMTTKAELSETIKELEWSLNKRKKADKSILKKIDTAYSVKNRIIEVGSDDIDDWDTPLGNWRED